MTAIRISPEGHVLRLTLCRPEAYNTITPQLRDELDAGLDRAEADDEVRVVLLDAEGPAFCAGYGVGFREAVRERDRPFGDYGERDR